MNPKFKTDAKTIYDLNGENQILNIESFICVGLIGFEDTYVVTLKNGLSTLIDKVGIFKYDNVWFYDWQRFNNDMFLVKNENNLWTPIYKKTGKLVYKNLWFKNWRNFGKDFFCIKNENGLWSLLNKKNGKLKFPHLWFKDWDSFNDQLYVVTNEDGKKTFIQKDDGSFLYEGIWFKKIFYPFDYDPILRSVILLESEEGLLTPLREKDASFIKKDFWFKKWWPFDDEYFIISNTDGYITLINKKDFSYKWDDKTWYEQIFKFTDDMYLVQRKDGFVTPVYKSNGKYVYDDKWFYGLKVLNDKTFLATYKPYLDKHSLINKFTGVRIETDVVPLFYYYEKFNDDLLLIFQYETNTWHLINIESGSEVYPGLSIKYFRMYKDNITRITREDGYVTLLNNSDGSFVNKNQLWFKEIKNLGSLGFLVTIDDENTKLFRFIEKFADFDFSK